MRNIIWISSLLPCLTLFGCSSTGLHDNTSIHSNNVKINVKNASALQGQTLVLTVLPISKLGSDGKMHDSISPSEFTMMHRNTVDLTVYNFDSSAHSIDIQDLAVHIRVQGSNQNGEPGVYTIGTGAPQTGDFQWHCTPPFDTSNGGWSLNQPGFGQGRVHTLGNPTNRQFIYLTVKDGLKYITIDGKTRITFCPSDFMVQVGIPVTVSITNFNTREYKLNAPELDISQGIKRASQPGVPTVTTFSFTPNHTGTFNWNDNNSSTIGGTIKVVKTGFKRGTSVGG